MGKIIEGRNPMEVVKLNNKRLNFIVRFKNLEFEKIFLEESDFYEKELKFTSVSKDSYVVSENPETNRTESIKAWYILHEKYRALSEWGRNAPVQFLGAFGVNGFPGVTIIPLSFLQA